MQGPTDAVQAAWAGLVRAQRAAVAGVESELRAAGFPPLSWYDVLWGLRRAEEQTLTPRELEAAMLLEQYNLSRLLDRMEADGLIRRIPYPGDKRRQLVQLTEGGAALQRKMWPVYAAAIQRHVGSKLTEAEAQKLARVFAKLTSKFVVSDAGRN